MNDHKTIANLWQFLPSSLLCLEQYASLFFYIHLLRELQVPYQWGKTRYETLLDLAEALQDRVNHASYTGIYGLTFACPADSSCQSICWLWYPLAGGVCRHTACEPCSSWSQAAACSSFGIYLCWFSINAQHNELLIISGGSPNVPSLAWWWRLVPVSRLLLYTATRWYSRPTLHTSWPSLVHTTMALLVRTYACTRVNF